MDSKAIVARFEAERQALALMDHPNIAKVFDAGATDTGRPMAPDQFAASNFGLRYIMIPLTGLTSDDQATASPAAFGCAAMTCSDAWASKSCTSCPVAMIS